VLTQDYILVVPALDGVELKFGHAVAVEAVESRRPVLRVGPCVFEGAHEQAVGTGVALAHRHAGAPHDAPPEVHAVTQRRIVFAHVGGDLGALSRPPRPAPAAAGGPRARGAPAAAPPPQPPPAEGAPRRAAAAGTDAGAGAGDDAAGADAAVGAD